MTEIVIEIHSLGPFCPDVKGYIEVLDQITRSRVADPGSAPVPDQSEFLESQGCAYLKQTCARFPKPHLAQTERPSGFLKTNPLRPPEQRSLIRRAKISLSTPRPHQSPLPLPPHRPQNTRKRIHP